jgi:hypothetical protein
MGRSASHRRYLRQTAQHQEDISHLERGQKKEKKKKGQSYKYFTPILMTTNPYLGHTSAATLQKFCSKAWGTFSHIDEPMTAQPGTSSR